MGTPLKALGLLFPDAMGGGQDPAIAYQASATKVPVGQPFSRIFPNDILQRDHKRVFTYASCKYS